MRVSPAPHLIPARQQDTRRAIATRSSRKLDFGPRGAGRDVPQQREGLDNNWRREVGSGVWLALDKSMRHRGHLRTESANMHMCRATALTSAHARFRAPSLPIHSHAARNRSTSACGDAHGSQRIHAELGCSEVGPGAVVLAHADHVCSLVGAQVLDGALCDKGQHAAIAPAQLVSMRRAPWISRGVSKPLWVARAQFGGRRQHGTGMRKARWIDMAHAAAGLGRTWFVVVCPRDVQFRQPES